MVMETPTYVIEASALINGIHEIKQWVYEGSIHLVIPTCTSEQVEKIYKASIALKDVPKDTANARSSGRAVRKEQPLFDINPRTTWEFLSRMRSEKGEEGVKFQEENEEFTQWKEEEEKAAEKVETVPAPPTSFADALLRKLNMKDNSESNGPKTPTKPRLVARTNEPKSPWKYHKIPIVPSQEVPSSLKSLFSCVLWRLYESEKNPLVLENLKLLVGQKEMQTLAETLGIPVSLFPDAKYSLLETKRKKDCRSSVGELETDFSEALALSDLTQNVDAVKDEPHVLNGSTTVLEVAQPATPVDQATRLSVPSDEESQDETRQPQEIALANGNKVQTLEGSILPAQNGTSTQTQVPFDGKPIGLGPEHLILPSLEGKSSTRLIEPEAAPNSSENQLRSLEQLSRPSTAVEDSKSKDSDPDSDEEIIVFNPRARRASAKRQKDASRSRPGTSSGSAPKVLKSSPKASPSQTKTATNKDSNGDAVSPSTLKTVNGIVDQAMEDRTQVISGKLKSKIESTLKPESPVFTPGKPFIQLSQQVTNACKPIPSPEPIKPSPPKSPAIPTSQRNGPPRQPRATIQQRNHSQEKLRLQRENQQRESERMIKRQREAIQRRAKVVDKAVQKAKEKEEEKPAEKPAPRQIQMEPTNNPTVIDPDAFDRSYIVQPPINGAVTSSSSEKRRSKGHQHRGSGSKRVQGSPKRNDRTSEREVDYVLKSGAPRESVRGKGKLWVPT